MQYVQSISGSIAKTWNSINPATLSGAIDVIVVEQEDGSLACSPFHIRFGKFSLLRPSEKKVECKINNKKLDFPMKLGEGGEAFFVFETRENVPEALQTSPLISPASSPEIPGSPQSLPSLLEPDPFELEGQDPSTDKPPLKTRHSRSATDAIAIPTSARKAQSDAGRLFLSQSHDDTPQRSLSTDFTYDNSLLAKLERMPSDSVVPAAKARIEQSLETSAILSPTLPDESSIAGTSSERPSSPQPLGPEEAKARALNLSKKLWTSNISNQVTESGDLMLDMTGFKNDNYEALQAEGIARQLLSEEIDGPYDIGALIGADAKGNIWIYSSEEAKQAASRKTMRHLGAYNPLGFASTDALSDPGYHSDDAQSDSNVELSGTHYRRDSDSAVGLTTQPSSPGIPTTVGDPSKTYAKTLRLTSDQLKTIGLKSGANSLAFTVNRATCNATLWYWRYDVPIVISDIDGTITKSDVLGHVLNSIGRDWTHSGVAKLYTEISANGYNFLYLTSRSVGQADMTRAYLDGVLQDGYKLPKGPVILSPDRTIAALRREVYLRKPEIFKMACLRDIMALFTGQGGVDAPVTAESQEAGLRHITAIDNPEEAAASHGGKTISPFYAGFGNRLTDALSYRSVNIPSIRIFTINSNSEISLDLLSLNRYRTAYSTMREIVDHYFPPVGLLVKGGGDDFTDFNYWRERPLDVIDFTDSEEGDDDDDEEADDEDIDDDDDDDDREDDEEEEVAALNLRRMPPKRVAQSLLSEDEAGAYDEDADADDDYDETPAEEYPDPGDESMESGEEDEDAAQRLESVIAAVRISPSQRQVPRNDGEHSDDETKDEQDEVPRYASREMSFSPLD